jgi:hypothetical protein
LPSLGFIPYFFSSISEKWSINSCFMWDFNSVATCSIACISTGVSGGHSSKILIFGSGSVLASVEPWVFEWPVTEGPIRRPERGGGEWMGAELGLCPKFTTKDSHTSLPRSRSHNRPTNPRNKPQTIPKRKRNSRSKGLNSSTQHEVDHPQAPGGLSAWLGRTVCGLRRTIWKQLPNHQYYTRNNGPSAEHSWTVWPPRADRLTYTSQPKKPNKTDRNTDAQEQLKNTTNTQSAGSSRAVRDPLADRPPQVDRAARSRTRKHPTTYPFMDLPNGLSSWGKIWGRCEASLGDAMPQNLGPQMN